MPDRHVTATIRITRALTKFLSPLSAADELTTLDAILPDLQLRRFELLSIVYPFSNVIDGKEVRRG